MKYFKVVYNEEGKLVSAWLGTFVADYMSYDYWKDSIEAANQCKVHYKFGEWVEPKHDHGRLFCFSSYDQAWNWTSNMGTPFQIYECEVDGVEECAHKFFVDTAPKNIALFLNGDAASTEWAHAPSGTVAVRRLKLTKFVS